MAYTDIGLIADEFWRLIPKHYPFVIPDEYIIMPNHIHGIVAISKENYTDWSPGKMGLQSQNLAAIIRGFKSTVKRYANENDIIFNWQSRFYDHIIQNEKILWTVRNYIKKNPDNWDRDKDNLKGLKM
jgi:putative transposase